MATKREMLDREDSCLNKAAEDEPIFVLRAQDAFSAMLVDTWADRVKESAWHQPDPVKRDAMVRKSQEAHQVAMAMRMWPTRKVPD